MLRKRKNEVNEMKMLYFRLNHARSGYSVQGSYDEHKWSNICFFKDKQGALDKLDEYRKHGFTIC